MKKDRNRLKGFSFLSPLHTIRNGHLSKSDVKSIKLSLSHKMSATSLVIGAILFLVSLILLTSMGVKTGGKQIEVYGLASFVAQVVSVICSALVIAFEIISLKANKPNVKNCFSHVACTLMYVTMEFYLFMSFYADASGGFLSKSETISASLILISLLILIQPVYWRQAAVLDGSVSIGLIVLSIVFTNVYHIQALMYYLFIAFVYPIGSYLIICILFYAETQKYLEELRNEALHNTAMYDELTRCKNRYALKEDLANNAKRWEGDRVASFLVMMFDIDEFKLYNDQFSHIGGDYCLKSIAECVRNTFPSPSLYFYRFGGEEFLFMVEVDSRQKAEAIMERIRNAVKGLGIIAAKGAPNQYVTISAGGSYVKARDFIDFEDLIKRVDACLYKAKGSGKDVCVLDGRNITPINR